jgi:hypothetical protein
MLETRELLSASPAVFEQFTMAPGTDSAPTVATLHMSPSDFTFHKNRVLLEMTLFAPDGSSGSALMAMAGESGASGAIVSQTRHPSGGAADVMIVSVGPGNYTISELMPGATGPLHLQVSLVGDVTGSHSVTSQDVGKIKSLIGSHSGQSRYSSAADLNGDGKINAQDLALAKQNVGASTQVQLLTVTAGLSASSNPSGNGVVNGPDVTVVGQTQPGATVKLDQGDTGTFSQTTTADAQGQYQFALSVPTGVTPLHIESDAGGQEATADIKVTRGDAIIAWNETMLDAIRITKDTLGLSTRTMAMVQAAVYDAVNSIDHIGSAYHVSVQAAPGASPVAAASEAAYDVLLSLIPSEKALYDATLAETLAQVPDASARAAGVAVGDAVAASILAWRANDGSNVQVPYVPGKAPGQWRPTPPDFTDAWGPEWGKVTPFAIPNAAQFLPPAPPALNSAAYAAALKQVESIGAKDSTTRTAQQTQIADFWGYDVAGVGPPPVNYNQITQAVASQQHNTFDQNARLFALVNVAMVDAGIVTWDAKFQYNLWRPVTSIPLANQDGNPATSPDKNWQPLGAPGDGVKPNFTPPFPAYPSGHAAFGGALFTTLADFYGSDNVTFTITSDEEPGIAETFNSFSAAAEENGMSRIYLGIHYIFDKTNGIAEGDSVGNYVFQNVMKSNS